MSAQNEMYCQVFFVISNIFRYLIRKVVKEMSQFPPMCMFVSPVPRGVGLGSIVGHAATWTAEKSEFESR
jgi:hypothetical protein